MKKGIIVFIVLLGIVSSCKKDENLKDKEPIDQNEKSLIAINSLDVFNEKIESGVALMFFHATWCSICEEQRPFVEEVAKLESLQNAFFGQIDFDDNTDIKFDNSVSGIPVILIFKDGLEVERLEGSGHSTQELKSLVLSYL